MVAATLKYQGPPEIVSDNAGGAIITWTDQRNGLPTGYDIYAQRIGTNGNAAWLVNGVIVSNALESQTSPKIAEDGMGGAIVAWSDSRNFSTTSVDIYYQRISNNGVAQLSVNGEAIVDVIGQQTLREISSNGNGGFYINWTDINVSANYVQLYDQLDQKQWSENGAYISASSDISSVLGGDNGVIYAWSGLGVIDYDIFAQGIDSLGRR